MLRLSSAQVAVLVCLLVSSFVFGQSGAINPTGTYALDGRPERFGHVKVKQIDSAKIVVLLFVSIGAASYNHGFAYDTLDIIKNNYAIYKTSADTSCKIVFNFREEGIKVEEITLDYNVACGFGRKVVVDGFYRRKSNKVPTDEELNEH